MWFRREKMFVWNAVLAQEENFMAVPGQVTLPGNGYIEVATEIGKLRINMMQDEEAIVSPNTLICSIRDRLK